MSGERSLLLLAQLQTATTPKHALVRIGGREPRTLDPLKSGKNSGSAVRSFLPAPVPTTTRWRSIVGRDSAREQAAQRWFRCREQRAQADGFAQARRQQQGGGTGCDNKQRQRPRAGLAAARAAAATTMPRAGISPRAGRRRLALQRPRLLAHTQRRRWKKTARAATTWQRA